MHASRTVAIAGASGFVGSALVKALLPAGYRVVSLGRRRPAVVAEGVEFRECDLFSLAQVEQCLAGVDLVVYLVHSMSPQARLAQGDFEDFDCLCADNMARAAASCGVQRIVYLGGLIPDEAHLSPHLQSRLETERVLASRRTPVTTLRAGIVIGPGGSSFRILHQLVDKLPVMICPAWTRSITQPIALRDVLTLLQHCMEDPEVAGRTFDVGGPEVLSYRAMMERTARLMGKRNVMLPVPMFTPNLSLLWVKLITGVPLELIRPLVQSLRHDMKAHDKEWLEQRAGLTPTPLDEMLREALAAENQRSAAESGAPVHALSTSQVQSIQRLTLPAGWDASRVARAYMAWLPTAFRGLIRVEVDPQGRCRFLLPVLSKPVLELTFDADSSTAGRSVFHVTGGLLATPAQGARLEFRAVPGEPRVLSAVQDFVPSLPWPIYLATQAQAHLGVMRAFGRHLERLDQPSDHDPHRSILQGPPSQREPVAEIP